MDKKKGRVEVLKKLERDPFTDEEMSKGPHPMSLDLAIDELERWGIEMKRTIKLD